MTTFELFFDLVPSERGTSRMVVELASGLVMALMMLTAYRPDFVR
ncbi:hypothetical protein QF037_010000 [Streptomyces canus]|nr:hypothetical protein [Streptomyces canus]MDQ0605567.1 hypothetical protein [Streptomyces canus]